MLSQYQVTAVYSDGRSVSVTLLAEDAEHAERQAEQYFQRAACTIVIEYKPLREQVQ